MGGMRTGMEVFHLVGWAGMGHTLVAGDADRETRVPSGEGKERTVSQALDHG